jgi:glutamate 5-kinase
MRGSVKVDEGAVIKLRDEGKSLLPIGVHEVQGEFVRGGVLDGDGGAGEVEATNAEGGEGRGHGEKVIRRTR